ncbi:beta-N-acetylhexosaminidase [Pedobacter yulinensis]|uniref:beta-N-acetylhexosaminidase n=2 Tax=Pedobacter yulinensis TaxID=2126353 RepID=A0A2T3HJ18_9SPHI|nr:beta-N-acetylhexosaminidase [Pedobacter yulinensis]
MKYAFLVATLTLSALFTWARQAPDPYAQLLPMPRSVVRAPGVFDLQSCQAVVVTDRLFGKEALVLQGYLKTAGLTVPVKYGRAGAANVIELATAQASGTKAEAYRMSVSKNSIVLRAGDRAGMFYALATLRQLISDQKKVPAAELTDWPAFSWRGYMIDAGRNFMPMHLLKQQIDVMSRYKYNIFHFHFTEDLAWRLQSKRYPQLTDPETMLRDKGKYYTEQDLKELIAYCRERHITLVPEIDMPGHSAAFKRAMKVDMQSDSGLAIVKNIIREFCSTYDVPYLHIGADEVKITNKNFLPEVTQLIESLGKKVIGWEPGGNFSETTIRQLWMEGATKVSANKNIRYVDSRHLYLNHMDPLESVVTIFNRQICNLNEGSPTALGGIICAWPDRRVHRPEDIFIQNPIYPAMLAFAERSWRGGGTPGWTAAIGAPGSDGAKTFAAFENRLLLHKKRHFAGLPFPYARQSDQVWKFFGPYPNAGDLSLAFAPEKPGFDPAHEKHVLERVGGTLVLRHWWAPQVKGVLPDPREQTTWYATTRIWSDEARTARFWIGFNNISRSYESDSPAAGMWDNRGSQVFVNGQIVQPPAWSQAGMKGQLERPLVDEGYEYREPALIRLKKGWNDVCIKLPIASFRGADWKNPQKWMFTFVEAGQ